MGQPRGGRRLVNTVLASGSLMVLVYWLALSHGDITSLPTPRELAGSGAAAEAQESPAWSHPVSALAQPQVSLTFTTNQAGDHTYVHFGTRLYHHGIVTRVGSSTDSLTLRS